MASIKHDNDNKEDDRIIIMFIILLNKQLFRVISGEVVRD